MRNVVMIYCDELRCNALSCYGNPYGIQTPNIDALAKEGVLFEQCYCASPVCVPSRYAMLTSRAPTHTGVLHNEAAMPYFHLDHDYLTFPQVMAKAGYRTASFGKTHIPQTQEPVFEVNDGRGGEMNLGIKIKDEAQNIMKLPGQFQSILAADYPADKPYTPELVTKHGLEWIMKQEEPFFVRFSYLQPHTPIVVPHQYVKKLDGIVFDENIELYETSEFEKRFSQICDIQSMKPKDAAMMRKYYYALVLWIDEQVGKIVQTLKEHSLYEDTIIIFTADHGACRGENGMLAKQTFQKACHQIPMIIKADQLSSQRRSDVCTNLDTGPTLLGLCGLAIPSEFEGLDLFKEKHEEVYAAVGYGKSSSRAFPNKNQGRWSSHEGWPQRVCIRTDRYRLDMNTQINGQWVSAEQEDVYFTDRLADPKEMKNLVSMPQYRLTISELYDKLKAYSQDQKQVCETQVQLDMERINAYLKAK